MHRGVDRNRGRNGHQGRGGRAGRCRGGRFGRGRGNALLQEVPLNAKIGMLPKNRRPEVVAMGEMVEMENGEEVVLDTRHYTVIHPPEDHQRAFYAGQGMNNPIVVVASIKPIWFRQGMGAGWVCVAFAHQQPHSAWFFDRPDTAFPQQAPNPHDSMANDRQALRRLAVKEIGAICKQLHFSEVMDVGGGRATETTFKDLENIRVHACCPQLQEQDAARARDLFDRGVEDGGRQKHISYCPHSYGECMCMRRAKVNYSCNSIYYLNQLELERYFSNYTVTLYHEFQSGQTYLPNRNEPEFVVQSDMDGVTMSQFLDENGVRFDEANYAEPRYEHPDFTLLHGPTGSQVVIGNTVSEIKTRMSQGDLTMVVTKPVENEPVSVDELGASKIARLVSDGKEEQSMLEINRASASLAETKSLPHAVVRNNMLRQYESQRAWVMPPVDYKMQALNWLGVSRIMTSAALVSAWSLQLALECFHRPNAGRFARNFLHGYAIVSNWKAGYRMNAVIASAIAFVLPSRWAFAATMSMYALGVYGVFQKTPVHRGPVTTGVTVSTSKGKIVMEPGSSNPVRDGVYTLVTEQTGTVCLGPPTDAEVQAVTDQGHTLELSPGLRSAMEVCPEGQTVGATCVGPVFRENFVLRGCVCNAANAMAKRHLAPSPQPQDEAPWGEAADMAEHVGQVCAESFPRLRADYDSDWWGKWSMAKRLLFHRSILDVGRLTHGAVKMFVKRELYHRNPTKARAIQQHRDLATQYATAIDVCAAQASVKEALVVPHPNNDRVRVVFGCGMNPTDLGAMMKRWLDEGYDCFIESDGKNWDATMNPRLQELKFQTYAEMGMPEDCIARLTEQLNTRGFFRKGEHFFRYSSVGTVKSGHNDTTLGNSIINGCISAAAMIRAGIEGYVIVVGDDALVATTRAGLMNAEGFAQALREFGIVPEYKTHDSWITASFISGYWYPTMDGFTFGPKIGRLLARLNWTVRPPGGRQIPIYKKAVAFGLKAMWNVPIAGEFIRSGIEITESRDPTKLLQTLEMESSNLIDFLCHRKMYLNHLCPEVARIPDSIWTVLGIRYDLSVQELKTFRDFVLAMPIRPCFVRNATADAIMEIDCS